MYLLARLMLIAATTLLAYCAALGIEQAIQEMFPQNQELVWSLLIVGGIAIVVRKRGRRLFTSGGTAAWASNSQLERAGMLGTSTGLILGRVPSDGIPIASAVKALLNLRLNAKDACREFFANINPRKRKQGRLARLSSTSVHTSVYVPTGGGKGVSLIVPFLLTNDDSCVIVDGKDGELARLTAAARKRMGHQVILLDPSRIVTQKPDKLNLLDFIDRNSLRAVNEADAIANALVIRTGQEKEPHWNDKAEQWLSALIASTIWFGEKKHGTRSLLQVADIASNPAALKTALKLMQASPEIWNGSLTRKGGMLSHSVAEELGSTLSTLGRFINFVNTPSAAESLQSSSFDLSRLRKGKMSIYLIQRAADTRTGSPLLRLWLNACIREVMKGGLNQKRTVHAIIDEAGSVGQMDCISDVLNVGRGFGLKLQLYYQDMGRLKECWKNPQGVLSNTTQIFFSVNDPDTADYVSKRLGSETILVEGGGRSASTSRGTSFSSGTGSSSASSSTNWSGSSSSDWKQQSRELLKSAEIQQLDRRIAITLMPGARPLWTTLIRYYEEKALLRYRGWFLRMIAAGRMLLLSATLLFFALIATAAIHQEARRVTHQPQLPPVSFPVYQPQPRFFRPAPGEPRPRHY